MKQGSVIRYRESEVTIPFEKLNDGDLFQATGKVRTGAGRTATGKVSLESKVGFTYKGGVGPTYVAETEIEVLWEPSKETSYWTETIPDLGEPIR